MLFINRINQVSSNSKLFNSTVTCIQKPVIYHKVIVIKQSTIAFNTRSIIEIYLTIQLYDMASTYKDKNTKYVNPSIIYYTYGEFLF